MYEITEWDDIARVAPVGARFFRYRRPTGERRKFYEGGFAFPISPEGLGDRKPAHSDGVFAVYFYTDEEAAKPADKASPMIVQLPDSDELLIEFRRGFGKGDGPEGLIIRELLNSNKDLARTAAASSDAAIKLLEKASHERDVLAEEAEKNRIGPVWQIILMHHPEIKEFIVGLTPLAASFASKLAASMNSASSASLIEGWKKEQQEALADIRRTQQQLQAMLKSSRSSQRRAKPAAKRSAAKKSPAARRFAKKR